MTTVAIFAAWLALSLFVTFQANKLAQRLFPTTAGQSPERRYAYGLIVRLLGIAAFLLSSLVIMAATILLGIARW